MTMSGRHPLRIGLSYLWAILPALSLGYAAPIVFFLAAARRRSRSLWIASAGYTSAVAVELATVEVNDPIFYLAASVCTLGATAHALTIRQAVFIDQTTPSSMELAIDAEHERRRLRARARAVAAEDPALALDLGIGRPDLPRSYDDGGVIDVNHVPADTLATLPGVTSKQAELILRLREQHGGFLSANELCVLTGLPAELATAITDRTVFLPRRSASEGDAGGEEQGPDLGLVDDFDA